MTLIKKHPEGDVPGDTFELLGVDLTYDQLLAILDGFHTKEYKNLTTPSMTHFGWREDDYYDDPEGVRWLAILGTWPKFDGKEVDDSYREYRIGHLQFIKTGEGRGNIIGVRERQTSDGAAVFDQMWAHIEASLNVEISMGHNDAKTKEIEVNKIPKAGRRRYSDYEKLTSLKAWDAVDTSINPETVEEFLARIFGAWEDGSPMVARSTFYGWKRELKKKGLY